MEELKRQALLREVAVNFKQGHAGRVFNFLARDVNFFREKDVGSQVIKAAKRSGKDAGKGLRPLIKRMPASCVRVALATADQQGGTALHWVARLGTREDAKLLVARGADFDARVLI